MRFNLTQVNILEENTKVTGLHITLIGDDNSTHTLKMDIKGVGYHEYEFKRHRKICY
nr:Uncharacterised protein [Providencia rettgeri]